jgi:DNA-binding transcriptional LysR family regulator
MDSFAGIEAFAAVVERGSFTAAAAALQTAKSSISETVRALEDRLGVRLLERTTRRVRPTEAGAAYYAQCRRLLDAAAAARSEAQAVHRLPVGRLRVGAPDAFTERLVADLLVAGLLTRVLVDYETPSVGIDAVYPTNRLLAPRVRVFVDHIVRDLRARGLPR